MRIRYKGACDYEKRAAKFVLANFPMCMFKAQNTYLTSFGECWRCGDEHGVEPTVRAVDCLLSTPPCQPFTTMRSRRGNTVRTGETGQHPDLHTSIFEFLEILQAVFPKGGVFENVPAISHRGHDEFLPAGFESWSQYLVHMVRQLGYLCWAVELDQLHWINLARPRWYLIYLLPTLGGSRALVWIRARIMVVEKNVVVRSTKGVYLTHNYDCYVQGSLPDLQL